MSKRAITSGYAWEQVHKRVLAASSICHLCGEPVDFDAPPRTSRSPSVDHKIPVSQMGHLSRLEQQRAALDITNLRTAHYGCNASRGSKPARPVRKASQQW